MQEDGSERGAAAVAPGQETRRPKRAEGHVPYLVAREAGRTARWTSTFPRPAMCCGASCRPSCPSQAELGAVPDDRLLAVQLRVGEGAEGDQSHRELPPLRPAQAGG